MGRRKFSEIVIDANYLHQQSQPVNMDDKELVKHLEDSLMSVYYERKGGLQGLAGVQIRQPYYAILVRYNKWDCPIVMFNPTVHFKFGSKKSNEGCLSEPGHRYIVRRPLVVMISWEDSRENLHHEWLTYKKARIFMHEFDHLYGRLLQDIGKEAY